MVKLEDIFSMLILNLPRVSLLAHFQGLILLILVASALHIYFIFLFTRENVKENYA